MKSRNQHGQGLAEYALILALISIVVIAVVIFLGNELVKGTRPSKESMIQANIKEKLGVTEVVVQEQTEKRPYLVIADGKRMYVVCSFNGDQAKCEQLQ